MNPKVLLISFNYSKCYYSDHLHFIAALVWDNIYVRHLVIEWYSQNMWELIQESIKNEKSNVIYFLCDNFDIISSDLAHYYGQKIKENFWDRVNIWIQSHYDKYFQRNLWIGQYYLWGAQGFSTAVKSFKDTREMQERE